ncbi:MAG: glycine cleavage system protein GcvH [Planctomycetota bacterium]|nr:glycine cleavage system protein GcvH [Planctomycetota bacterium]
MSNFPNDLRYAETHEWVRLEGEMAIVGLSAFAVEQLTDLIVMDLAKAGSKVTAGGRLGEVESVKSVNDIYAPISGEVVEVNAEVVADLSKLSSDPYGAGWLVRIKPENLADVAALMSSTDYAKAVAGADH